MAWSVLSVQLLANYIGQSYTMSVICSPVYNFALGDFVCVHDGIYWCLLLIEYLSLVSVHGVIMYKSADCLRYIMVGVYAFGLS